MSIILRFVLPLAAAFNLIVACASAQVTPGTPPFGSYGGGEPDIVDLANLNTHISVPILHKAGRGGMDFDYDFGYDSSIWYPVGSSGSQSWQPVTNWGWSGSLEGSFGYIQQITTLTVPCLSGSFWNLHQTGTYYQYTWSYFDTHGTTHFFGSTGFVVGTCSSYSTTSLNTTAADGSGYAFSATGGTVNSLYNSAGQLVSGSGGLLTDRNGNEISASGGVFTDTLGTTALTVAGSGTPSSPLTLTYTAPSGASPVYTVKYTTYSIQTNFGCSGITDYGTNGTTTTNLVSEIDLPEYNSTSDPNARYLFSYESTPGKSGFVTGRLGSVTLPTGGSVSYTYTGGSSGHITCADGSTPGLQRVLSDGASWSATWTYARTAGSGAAYTIAITDPERDSLAPNGNNTIISFQGLYEVQRQVYQGLSTNGTLLETLNTCYNGSSSPCTSTAITLPIASRKLITVLPGGLQSEHDDSWNGPGSMSESDDYDYGSGAHGALLKRVLVTYASLGNVTAFRQTVITCNGTGSSSTCNNTGTPVSEVTYNYDQTTPTSTSGIPQHVSVSGSRGNLTSVYRYTSSGTYLTKSSTYYDTGSLSTTSDVNGGVTTYNYTSGTASCYNTFPTSVNEAVSGLTTNATWNCTGGVQVTAQDENSQTTTTTYNDPYYWRPYSVADPTSAITYYCYGVVTSGTCTINPNQSESYLTFNSSHSTADRLTTLDGLGRTRIRQTRQTPTSTTFDSVETDYDALGRANRVTLPYSATAGILNSSIASTTTTYDPFSRPLTLTDGGGGTTTYNYGNGNDTLITRSPAPTGENSKVHQFEYDGLERLTSVCEVTAGTTAWPGGTCAQTTNKTGYWTKYTLGPMGNLLTVTQNAQSPSSQTRAFAYDWLSRMTSETVPEIGSSGNGTATYTYDTDSTCGTSGGDLVKKVDAAGNVICSAYDALHRLVTRTYPSGVYSSATPSRHFVYDAATVSSVAMANAKSRLAEAYTCTGSCATKLTDLGQSYTIRGEISDVYESTPNSGSYYHVSQTYWANHLPYQLTGNVGLPFPFTYTPDGEGRINSISASSGQNPVSSTTYSTASLPTAINLGSGSGDADSYTWDPNTNRMTQYQFTVNGTSLTGVLGWNANGTLQTQNITDGFNSSDAQDCSYQYDDITRVLDANCGSVAAQTFGYDPFGNITKSGSPYSFQPTYSTSTNRMTAVGSFTPTYDGNGNVTNDNIHNYAWDAEAHAITVDAGLSDAVNLTYDALGRMVEQNRGGTYTQIAYSTSNHKLALMSGATLQKAMVPISGKAQVVYNSSGLLYYAHVDLLGSVRLATTPSRTSYFDTAYAPFGETYASTGNVDPAYTGKLNDTAHREDVAGGLYDFPAREYSTEGRWPSPDPLGLSATGTKNPQTQNRYAYVTNNPLSYTDPLGMQPHIPCFLEPCGGCDTLLDPTCAAPPCDDEDPNCPNPLGYGGGGGGAPPPPPALPSGTTIGLCVSLTHDPVGSYLFFGTKTCEYFCYFDEPPPPFANSLALAFEWSRLTLEVFRRYHKRPKHCPFSLHCQANYSVSDEGSPIGPHIYNTQYVINKILSIDNGQN